MKKLLILALAAALFLSSCVQDASNSDIGKKETLNYTIDSPTEAEPDATTEPVTEAATESVTESASETESAITSAVTETLAPETAEPETEPEEVHVTEITLSIYEFWLKIGESHMPIVTMTPDNAPDKGEKWESSDTDVATVDKYGNVTAVDEGDCIVKVTSTDSPDVFAEVKVHVLPKETETETTAPAETEPSSDSPATDVTYIGGILVVNKTYSLPADYNPGVDKTAQDALYEMFAAASAEGLSLWVRSGVRTYADQKWQYNVYVERDGKALADTYSARPGHSEHQTGLAFDLNSLYTSFGETAEGKWLAANCHKYGFIIRYPAGKEHITGYMYEPWHVRYVGMDHAPVIYEKGLCLEEYLGITSQYNY